MNAKTAVYYLLLNLVGAPLAMGVPLNAVVDFETLPDGSPSADNVTLDRNQAYAFGEISVRFGFDTDDDGVADVDAVIEQVGNNPPEGFIGPGFSRDGAQPGFAGQLGDFFLRNSDAFASPGVFVIDYDVAGSDLISLVSGEIWDIDGAPGATEQWEIRAYDQSNNLLATTQSPEGGIDANLNGLPFVFIVKSLAGIDRLEIEFIGSKTSGVGLAFNNYRPAIIPEPTVAIMLTLSTALTARRRAHRKIA